MTDADVNDVLRRAAWMMEESWLRDVLPLRASQKLHERIEPHLPELDIDGRVIGRLWYQDHVLSSIRRMVDTGNDVVSTRQALYDLRRIAEELTPEVLLDFHGRWHDDEDEDLRLLAETIRTVVAEARPDDPEAETSRIGVRTVQADLNRIREVADRAHRLATLVSSHRLDIDEQVTVTADEIEQLLDDLSAIYRRWSRVLRAAEVHTSIDHFQVGIRAAEALATYDPVAMSAARREYLHDRPRARPPSREDLAQRTRVSYYIEDAPD